MLGLVGPLAVRLLLLRSCARQTREAAATSIMPALWLRVLELFTNCSLHSLHSAEHFSLVWVAIGDIKVMGMANPLAWVATASSSSARRPLYSSVPPFATSVIKSAIHRAFDQLQFRVVSLLVVGGVSNKHEMQKFLDGPDVISQSSSHRWGTLLPSCLSCRFL